MGHGCRAKHTRLSGGGPWLWRVKRRIRLGFSPPARSLTSRAAVAPASLCLPGSNTLLHGPRGSIQAAEACQSAISPGDSASQASVLRSPSTSVHTNPGLPQAIDPKHSAAWGPVETVSRFSQSNKISQISTFLLLFVVVVSWSLPSLFCFPCRLASIATTTTHFLFCLHICILHSLSAWLSSTRSFFLVFFLPLGPWKSSNSPSFPDSKFSIHQFVRRDRGVLWCWELRPVPSFWVSVAHWPTSCHALSLPPR